MHSSPPPSAATPVPYGPFLLKTVGAAAYIVSFAVVHQFLQQHYARTCLGSFWSAAFSTDHSPVCSLLKKSLDGFQLLPLLPALALRGI